MSLDAIIRSITLHNIQVKEMGLQMAGSVLIPFSKTGLKLAFVLSDGFLPVDIDFWKSS